MYHLTSILLLSLLVTAKNCRSATPAPIITNNAVGVTYSAIFPDNSETTIRGYVSGTSASNGTGTNFNVNITGLPDVNTEGPFMYHIHQNRIPANGNCTAAGAHLDPYLRGESPACDASDPSTCQVGDLSGKHGNITATPWKVTYLDDYLSTTPDTVSFFGNLSLVIHARNLTRIACTNFTLGNVSSSSTTTATTTMTTGTGMTGTNTGTAATGTSTRTSSLAGMGRMDMLTVVEGVVGTFVLGGAVIGFLFF
ncbi:MAG: hypothetical protein M1834_005735 [Cirrosporium novae-zelandiae]|nr:MAG: hypothetical protein M1834_005735 [Cirrosporium novae-zelandiae]